MLSPRYDTIRDMMHTIRYVPRYIAIFTWEAEACDPGLRSEALHSTYYNAVSYRIVLRAYRDYVP